MAQNYPQRFVLNQQVQAHAVVTGFPALHGSTIACSFINSHIISQHLRVCHRLNTCARGTWNVLDNTAWAPDAFQNAPRLLRLELEPSNGVCLCCGVADPIANGAPAADPNSILLRATDGQLAGHVQKDVAHVLAQRGLTALCRSVNGALPACQMLALTDPTQPVPPPAGALGAKPRAMGMDVYVFTQQGNASIPAIFNNIINDLAALPPPFPQLPVPSLAPIALNAVPNQVMQHTF